MGVSVVIPNYNGQKYIKECLGSLKLQSMKPESIIIVDNNSTDNSLEIINNCKISNLNIIRLEHNKGFSVAVNEGIKANKSEFVILLNNDTVLDHYFIEKLYNSIKLDKNIFACCSKMIRYSNKNIIDDAGDGYTIFGFAKKYGDGKSINQFCKRREVFSACAGACIYRSEIFNEIGLFDENFFAYLEDVDISYRARIYGYKNYFEPEAKVYHIGSATSGSRHNDFKVKLAARNNIYLLHKNMPIFQIILNGIFLFTGIAFKFVYFSLKGFGKVYFSGICEGLKTKRSIKKIASKKYLHKSNFRRYIKIQMYLLKDTINLLKRG